MNFSNFKRENYIQLFKVLFHENLYRAMTIADVL